MQRESDERTIMTNKPLLVHATLMPAPQPPDATVDLQLLLRFARRYGLRIVLLGIVAAGAALAVSYMVPKVYRAEATVVPVTPRDNAAGLGALTSRLGGVAGLLGVDIGGNTSTATSLAQLQSRQLIMLFISERNLLPVLFPERWDSAKKAWRVAPDKVPTLQEGYLRFARKIFSVREDRKNELVIVAVQWWDPATAADWANAIVARANDFLATQAAQDAERNMEYLNKELEKATELELRQAMYTLIEAEIQKRMLSRTQRDYAFRVLDPAITPLPNRYVKPQRVLYVAGGLLAGMALGVFWFLLRERRRSLSPAA